MALTIRFTRFSPHPPEGLFMQWTLDGVTPQMNGDFTFSVERSGSSLGPWELIASGLINNYAYFDKFPQPPNTSYRDVRPTNMFSFGRDFFYRVKVKAPNGESSEAVDEASSTPFMDPKIAGHARKATKNIETSLRINGTEAALFKRLRWGVRCVCVDKQTREPTRSQCKICYGTGFRGGFFEPVIAKVRRSIPQGASAVMPEQRTEGSSVRITYPSNPGLDQGDLLVFLRDGRRYEIDQPSDTQFQLNTLHQYCDALELPRTHVYYQVVVNRTLKDPWL